MRVLNTMVALAVLATPAASMAQTAAPAAATTAKNDPNRLICRAMDTTGSRLGKKKECHTAAQWTELQALDRREVERYQANRSARGN